MKRDPKSSHSFAREGLQARVLARREVSSLCEKGAGVAVRGGDLELSREEVQESLPERAFGPPHVKDKKKINLYNSYSYNMLPIIVLLLDNVMGLPYIVAGANHREKHFEGVLGGAP
jgi:hypothetical protein